MQMRRKLLESVCVRPEVATIPFTVGATLRFSDYQALPLNLYAKALHLCNTDS